MELANHLVKEFLDILLMLKQEVSSQYQLASCQVGQAPTGFSMRLWASFGPATGARNIDLVVDLITAGEEISIEADLGYEDGELLSVMPPFSLGHSSTGDDFRKGIEAARSYALAQVPLIIHKLEAGSEDGSAPSELCP